jgi:hypothetical protein
VDLFNLAEDKDKERPLMKAVIHFQFYKTRTFLIS